ncbi:MAG: squalene synthase HpnC [bacterium]
MDQKNSIDKAYAVCKKIALGHYENFPVGSFLLPRRLRNHFYALYAFMRTADDYADMPERRANEKQALLKYWRSQLDLICGGGESHEPVFIALKNSIQSMNLPVSPLYRLLEAFEFDATGQVKFNTFEELRWYTHRSANPVGELVLALFGENSEANVRLSDDICTALQLLNFIQDIREDLSIERFYYPTQDFAQTGIFQLSSDTDPKLLSNVALNELDRVESLLNLGSPLTESVRGRLRYELRAIVRSARKMIAKIRATGGDTFSQRPNLSKSEHFLTLIQALMS